MFVKIEDKEGKFFLVIATPLKLKNNIYIIEILRNYLNNITSER